MDFLDLLRFCFVKISTVFPPLLCLTLPLFVLSFSFFVIFFSCLSFQTRHFFNCFNYLEIDPTGSFISILSLMILIVTLNPIMLPKCLYFL